MSKGRAGGKKPEIASFPNRCLERKKLCTPPADGGFFSRALEKRPGILRFFPPTSFCTPIRGRQRAPAIQPDIRRERAQKIRISLSGFGGEKFYSHFQYLFLLLPPFSSRKIRPPASQAKHAKLMLPISTHASFPIAATPAKKFHSSPVFKKPAVAWRGEEEGLFFAHAMGARTPAQTDHARRDLALGETRHD